MKISNFQIIQLDFDGNRSVESIQTRGSQYPEKGFTIIELIIYIGIYSILLTILTTVFFSILDSQEESEATAAADENGRYILSRFIYDIPRAQSVSIPSTAGGQTSSLQISINSINYTYTLDNNGNLQLTNTLGVNNINGYDASISALLFQRLVSNSGKDSIKASFTVTSRTVEQKGARPQVRTFQTTLGLR